MTSCPHVVIAVVLITTLTIFHFYNKAMVMMMINSPLQSRYSIILSRVPPLDHLGAPLHMEVDSCTSAHQGKRGFHRRNPLVEAVMVDNS